MKDDYDHKEVEQRISKMWEAGNYFSPKIVPSKKTFSMFLVPPNASGGMHVGNVLMIAIQDILARYRRAKGDSTLWIPGTDHGGYETQVTFERELEKAGIDKSQYGNEELFSNIKKFVESNNDLIKNQIKSTGASVDWSRFRFTMDEGALGSVNKTFSKMVEDGLIYRGDYMVNYCSHCGTVLADIELKEEKENRPIYFVKFFFDNSDEFISLATFRPEFIFSINNVIINKEDSRFAGYIGRILKNPITGEPVFIIESKRKFDPEQIEPFLSPFCPSFKKYDYEYALRNNLPSKNLLDWDGNMLERYPGMKPDEARVLEVKLLSDKGLIEKVEEAKEDVTYYCKKGHLTETKIMLTWFLKLDDEKRPLRSPAIKAISEERLEIFPRWREKGLVGWMEKMHDWPIARQNVWGIKIPVWYEIKDSSKFTVWFVDHNRERHFGNLKTFIDNGVPLAEVLAGLERVYAEEDVSWTMNKKEGPLYLPETDTFDTWFSSGQWGTIVFEDSEQNNLKNFYPSQIMVIGHDLLRLSISRKILLSKYLSGKLPFRKVYLHRLIKGADGQKMSKSLGNSVSIEEYLSRYGADVTRMALISYTTLPDDFILSDEQLGLFKNFSANLWGIGQRIMNLESDQKEFANLNLSSNDKKIITEFNQLISNVSNLLDRLSFAFAQEKVCQFLSDIEVFLENDAVSNKNSATVIKQIFMKYLVVLHPFAPFMTEEMFQLFEKGKILAVESWPNNIKI